VSTTYAGSPVYFNVTALGGAPPYSYAFSGLPYSCPSQNVSDLLCATYYVGTFHVKVTVNDTAGGSVSAGTTVNFTQFVAPPPVLQSFTVSPSSVAVGSIAVLSANVTGGTIPLSFLFFGLPPGCASFNAAQLSCIPSGAGTFVVNCTVSDGIGRGVSALVTLTVTGAASPPAHGSVIGGPIPEVGLGVAGVAVLAIGVVAWRGRSGKRPPTPPA
jgi:hypothetical protein